jgi:general secretion pathway protein A
MYERFYGFRERPFDLLPNPRFLVMIPAHREALSNLEYGVASRKGITLLLGEAGSGKSTLLRAAIELQPQRVHCVYLPNPSLTRDEFIEMLAVRFELSLRARTSKASLLIELEDLLRQRDAQGESTILMVDEAQSLSFGLLEEVRLLVNFETTDHKLLSVILAGQPELASRLNDPSLRQLKQRVALRCELKRLELLETAAYLAGRIKAAGGVGAQVFTRDAVTLIHERSGGIPRTISVLADNALLSGFGQGERPVGRQTVLDVCADFDLHGTDDHTAPAETVAAPPAAPRPVAAPAPTPKTGPIAPAVLGPSPVRGSAAGHRGGLLRLDIDRVDQPESVEEIDAAPRRRFFGLFGSR